MQRKILTAALLFVLLNSGAPVRAETAADVIDRMADAEAGNYAGINNMFSVSRMMGQRVPEYFELEAGFWRSVPMGELLERQQPNAMADAPPEVLRDAANTLRRQGERADAALKEEIAKSGLANSATLGPIIHMASNPPKPWLASSPGGMMSLYATMLDAQADAKEFNEAEKERDVDENFENIQLIEDLKSSLRIIGNSNVQGYPVIELGADNLNVQQVTDGGSFTMDTVRILVDADKYFPRQMRFEGDLKEGKKSRRMLIERTDSTFMGGENCGELLRPRKSVMRLAGALSPSEQAELETARAQLAALPPEQKQMMKQMMGEAQFNMIENMSAGNGIEMVTDVLELRCNSAPPTAEEIAGKLR